MKLEEIAGNANDGLYRSKSGTIYFRKYREGKGEIFRSTKTKDLTLARRVRETLMAELWGDRAKVVKRETVPEIWAVWFEGMKATHRPNTLASISAAWNNFKPYLEDRFLSEITLEWWTNAYIPLKRAEQNKKPTLDNRKRKFFNEWKWLSMFLKWCEAAGKAEPSWKRPRLKNPDPPRDPGRVYSSDEISALKRNATLRMSAFLVAGERHFMRRSEIRLLTWDRVDLLHRTIKLRAQDTKTKKPRTFPISEELLSLFLELKSEAETMGLKSAFLFPSFVDPTVDSPMTVSEFRIMWEACAKSAGLPKGSRFHWLRHTGLTSACRRKGVDIAALCIFAGLSIEELQRTYLHYDTEDLRGVELLVGAV